MIQITELQNFTSSRRSIMKYLKSAIFEVYLNLPEVSLYKNF